MPLVPKPNSEYTLHDYIIGELMFGPKTTSQLSEVVEENWLMVFRAAKELRDCGVVTYYAGFWVYKPTQDTEVVP